MVTDARGIPLSWSDNGPSKPTGDTGDYSETILAAASEVTLTTATTKNVTSISLAPGEYDITGCVDFDLTGATVTKFIAGISTVSNTLGVPQDSSTQKLTALTTITGINMQCAPIMRFVITAATTFYLVAQATFSAGTMKAYGSIRARRIK